MESINGILILSPDERSALEAAIGPLTSCRVEDVRRRLVNMAERREAEGYFLWARIIRSMLEKVTVLSGRTDCSAVASKPIHDDADGGREE